MRIYLYKLRTDNGSAPAVARGMLTLAICKPRIRATAEVGDWIVGVAARSLRAGAPLIYVAQVTEVLEDGQYYALSETKRRRDAIYEWKKGRLRMKPPPQVHDETDVLRDIGSAPRHGGARVLVSKKFRYFGETASAWYASVSPRAHSLAESVGRGHRVNHSESDYLELNRVIRAAMRKRQRQTQPIENRHVACRH